MTKLVEVTITMEVTVDESKFTEAFFAEFRESFYRFHTLDEHLCHIGQMAARGVISGWQGEFVEGYGADMGIRTHETFVEAEIA